ncbi:MAG TPA: hypothetical protein VF744_18565 [Beijerinckiaceae bacterium]
MSIQDETEPPKSEPDDFYNPAFEKLSAARSGPLTGALAYALYKTAKREWVREFRTRHGRPPNNEEYRHHSATQTDAILNAYVAQADQILGVYAQNVIRQERPKILEEALKGDFWRSFWPSLAASIAFALLLVVIVAIAAVLGFGLPVQINVPPR